MRTNRLLILAAALTTLGGGLWATLDVDFKGDSLPAVPVAGAEADDRRDAQDFPDLRSEINLLRAELHAMKELNRDADAVERGLLSLEQEVSALRRQVAMVADDGEPNDALVHPLEKMELFQEERAYEENERQRELGAHFAAQSVDTSWSLDAAELVSETALREELAQSSVDGIECRSSLCRVEVSHANTAAASEFALWFPVALGEALPQIRYFHEQRDDGHLVTVMYLAREGYDLPAEIP